MLNKFYTTIAKKLLQAAFVTLLANTCLAQSEMPQPYQAKLDSLNQILKQNNIHDTSRARTYVMMTEHVYYYTMNYDTIINLCQRAIDISNRILSTDPSHEISKSLLYSKALALNNMGMALGITKDRAKQDVLLHESIETYKKISRPIGLAEAYSNLGIIKSFYENSALDSTAIYWRQAIKLYKELNSKEHLSSIYKWLGNYYTNTSRLDSGLFYFRKAISSGPDIEQKVEIIRYMIRNRTVPDQILKEIGDTLFLSVSDTSSALPIRRVYNYLGQYFRFQGEYSESLQAYMISNSLSHKYGFIPEYINLGHLYGAAGDSKTAINYYQIALLYARDSMTEINLDLMGWAEVHIGKNIIYSNPDSGIYLMRTAIRHWEEAGKGHREMGAISNAYFELAVYYLNKREFLRALELADTIVIWETIEPTNRPGYEIIKARSYFYLNNLDSSLYYTKKWQKKSFNGDLAGYKNIGSSLGVYNLLSRIYEKQGRLDSALFYRNISDSLTAIINDKEDLASIAFHRQQRAVDKNNFENRLKINKVRQRQTLFAIGGLLILVLAGGLYSRLRYVKKSKTIIELERDRSDNLLHNILPAEVAAELKEKGKSEARDFDDVTVIFTDFVEFTQTAEKLSAKELVSEINTCFEAFDDIITKHKLEKIKTIGDAYMAAGGLHMPRTSGPKDVIKAALEMQQFMLARKSEREAQSLPAFDMRAGIHTGPVVAGIVGVKKFQYDIWGDTVNTASRMESMGEVSKVNISQATYELLKDDQQFTFESRGKVEVKGKGEMEMWFVSENKIKA